MLEIIGILLGGIIIGRLLRNISYIGKIGNLATLTVCILIFVLGISVGSNESVITEFHSVAIIAVVLGVCGIAGSIAGVALLSRLLYKKK